MKVKIVEDAYNRYLDMVKEPTDYWKEIFKYIQGKELEVDTDILFKYEFNIKPIAGVTEEEIRLDMFMVENVIDDVREDLYYCYSCNENSIDGNKCSNCGDKENLEKLID